jgi:hypothetical protein
MDSARALLDWYQVFLGCARSEVTLAEAPVYRVASSSPRLSRMSSRSVRSSLRWSRTYSGRTAPASTLVRRSSWQVMSLWRSGRMSGGSAAILRLRGGFSGRPWLLVRRDEPILVKRYPFQAPNAYGRCGAVVLELRRSGHRNASAPNALAGLYAHPPHRLSESRSSRRLAEKGRVVGHSHQDQARRGLAVESSGSLRREQPGDVDKRSKHSPGGEYEPAEEREPPPVNRCRFLLL